MSPSWHKYSIIITSAQTSLIAILFLLPIWFLFPGLNYKMLYSTLWICLFQNILLFIFNITYTYHQFKQWNTMWIEKWKSLLIHSKIRMSILSGGEGSSFFFTSFSHALGRGGRALQLFGKMPCNGIK